MSKWSPKDKKVFASTLKELDFVCGEDLFDKSRKDHKFFFDNEVQVDQRKTCSDPLSPHYYSWMVNQKPEELPLCGHCRELLTDEKIDKFNIMRGEHSIVIPCCESEECILGGVTAGAKGGRKGWITSIP